MPNNKDEWTNFVNKLLSRKRSNRPYLLPRDYIEYVADRIHSVNPTKGILINTLVEFYSTAFQNGYERSESDTRFRKEKKDKHIKNAWNQIKDSIDDEIHTKNK